MRNLTKCCSLFLVLVLSLNAHAINDKPFTIPELKTWKSGDGSFTPSSHSNLVYMGKDEEILKIVKQFAADYEKMFGVILEVKQGKASKGDFVFSIKKHKKANPESYSINIGTSVDVSAPTYIGLFWATRTLLQLAEQQSSQTLPCGLISDEPDYPFRGAMLDCGRKFLPMEMLRSYVQIMSYYKMNVLHIHLNDNGFPYFFDNDWNKTQAAFRLECDTYRGLTSRDGYYTKKEFIQLQELADSLGVEIIPEIDVPAHSLAFTHYNPEIGSKAYGMDHLDLFNNDTYSFLDGLFKEYLEGENPVFRGKYVHIGTDEYSNKDSSVVEKFRYFTDRYIRYIERFGKQAAIWGQQTHAKGHTPIKVNNVLMYAWSNDYAKPQDMMQLGYDLISIPDGDLYIVPKAGYYYDYLDTERLYAKWTPANINGMAFKEKHPKIKGGMFAVWNDVVGNGISPQDIHYRFMPALQTLATKMWTGANISFSYRQFSDKKKALSEAPDINYCGNFKPGIVLTKANVQPNEKNSIKEIGWKYKVSFDIDAQKEDPGTVFFETNHAKFYLSDPVSGLIGFSRDGYLYNFNYQFFTGEHAHVTVTGDQERTCLYINDKLVSALDVKKISFGERAKMNYIQTLVFPLEHTGLFFHSKVTNLNVESLAH